MLFDKEITVIRASNGQYVNGIYTDNTEEITIKCVITTKNMMNLYKQIYYDINQNGIDLTGYISVITQDTELLTVKTSNTRQADIVVYNGYRYKVLTSLGLQKLGNIQHYRHLACLESEDN
jgi:hypothetical protein